MDDQKKNQRKKLDRSFMDGFSQVSSTRIDWKSRKRPSSASGRNKTSESTENERNDPLNMEEVTVGPTEPPAELSERRKALFKPLEPPSSLNGLLRPSAESLLPPPDFGSTTHPRGWLLGKKRKLVNVDVVESMRRIAIQEMNRKDREIGELNEILDDDSKVLELVQAQLLDEKTKTSRLERENEMLRDQVKMLMQMLEDGEAMDDEDAHEQHNIDNEPNEP